MLSQITADADEDSHLPLSDQVARASAHAESVLPTGAELQDPLETRQTELKDAYLSVQAELTLLQREERVLLNALGKVTSELEQHPIPER